MEDLLISGLIPSRNFQKLNSRMKRDILKGGVFLAKRRDE